MLFALICTDKPGSLELRNKTRPDHLQFLKGLGKGVKAAGPFLNSAGDPVGSLVIIEAADTAAASAIAARDPYEISGLFATVDIRPWKWLVNNPDAD
jgi:uncharacterized protein